MRASETRDGMRVDWDCEIKMSDGLVLKADVFRPISEGQYPVIMTHGPYAKGLSFQEGYPSAWNRMVDEHPDVAAGSSNLYQNWEVADPEKWVPDGYVCLRVDSRGCGASPGYVDHFSPRETKDFAECINWAGVQPWSNGKVGLNGVSYYGINAWQVASLQPEYLAAICIWEGSADWYRDMTHHGGILSTFWANWYDMQVKSVQYGLGDSGPVSLVTGRQICGDDTLSGDQLAANRCDFDNEIYSHPFDDDYHKVRSAAWSKITTPILTAANWGGQGLHPRGNFEGFMRAASENKWLEAHGLEHWTEFYTDYGVLLQKRFFDYFLKGLDNGWDEQPRVQLQIRKINGFEQRHEQDWPIPRTQWTSFYIHENLTLSTEKPASSTTLSFDAKKDGLTFYSEPLSTDMEITGPSAFQGMISSSTKDADLFIVLQVFSPDNEEIVFQGAIDPNTPIGQGWLRASHRKLDTELSQSWRPYHTHDEQQLLEPGKPVQLDIEVWPTSIVIPAGFKIGLSIRGRDYENPNAKSERLSNFKNDLKGCGPFLHNDPRDRPMEVFGGTTTLHISPENPGFILLPVIPE